MFHIDRVEVRGSRHTMVFSSGKQSTVNKGPISQLFICSGASQYRALGLDGLQKNYGSGVHYYLNSYLICYARKPEPGVQVEGGA